MRRIEITNNWLIEANIYGVAVQLSSSTDDIQRFIEPEYDYLRYYDMDQRVIIPMWLGAAVLSDLAGRGIPETRQRLKMQQCEYDAYIDWHSELEMDEFESEFPE